MSLRPIEQINSVSTGLGEKKKEDKTGNGSAAGACLTERIVKSVSAALRTPAYEHEAYRHLRSFFFMRGPVLQFHVQCASDFAQTARFSPQDAHKLVTLRRHMAMSADAIREAIGNEIEAAESAGLGEHDARLDAIFGLQHLFGTLSAPVCTYADLFMAVKPEQRAEILDKLDNSIVPLAQVYEKLSTLAANQQNAPDFLYSTLNPKNLDEKV